MIATKLNDSGAAGICTPSTYSDSDHVHEDSREKMQYRGYRRLNHWLSRTTNRTINVSRIVLSLQVDRLHHTQLHWLVHLGKELHRKSQEVRELLGQ